MEKGLSQLVVLGGIIIFRNDGGNTKFGVENVLDGIFINRCTNVDFSCF